MPITGLYQPVDSTNSTPGGIVSVETFKALAENINYFIDSMPVGAVIWTLEGLVGMPSLEPRIWQECNGSLITEPNSPLLGQSTPDLRTNKGFLKAVSSGVGSFGGLSAIDITHSHGGTIGPSVGLNQDGDEDDDYYTAIQHTHTLPSVITTVSIEPEHIRLKAYYKIM